MENKFVLAIIILGCALVASMGIPIWFLEYYPLAIKLFVTLFAAGGSIFLALLGVYILKEA